MCAAPLTAMLLEDPKDQMETLALREKPVDRGCPERKEISVMWAMSVILAPLVTVE